MIDRIRTDVRYALRQLQRAPAFTLVASLSLAIGIGVAVGALSFLNALFFRPLPVPDPENIYRVYTSDGRGRHSPFGGSSYSDHLDFAQSGAFTGLAAQRDLRVALSGSGLTPSSVRIRFVSPNFFDVFGIRFTHGRPFSATGLETEVVISYSTWQRRLQADPNVIGRTLNVNGLPFTVIGVAPVSFRSSGFNGGGDAYGWIAAPLLPSIGLGEAIESRSNRAFRLTARLSGPAARPAAQARLASLAAGLARQFPQTWIDDRGEHRIVTLLTHRESLFRPGQRLGLMAVVAISGGLVFFVLLIACTNVAGLMLARALARRHEIAVRLTLGASRARLLAQLLTESALLALIGGGLGCLAARWLLDIVVAATGAEAADLPLDGRVLAGALCVSLFCALLFGLAPALQSLRVDVRYGLGSPQAGGAAPSRLRGRLLALQVGAAAFLIVLALGAARGVGNHTRGNPGFAVDDVLLAELDLTSFQADTVQSAAYIRQATETLGALAGVRAVGIASDLPLEFDHKRRSVRFPDGEERSIEFIVVGPTFFDVLQIPILRGRGFRRDDSRWTVVVNETFARMYGQQLVGRGASLWGTTPTPVVGVARDVAYHSPGEDAQPYVYLLNDRFYDAILIARVEPGAERSVIATAQRRFRARFPEHVAPNIRSLRAEMVSTSAPQRLAARVALSAGAIELALAAVGLYGLLVFGLLARTREIGVRLALGADRREAGWAVARDGLRFAAIGAFGGLALAIPASLAMARMLVGARPGDPVPFLATLGALMCAAAVAAIVPARRAARIEPAAALRHD